MKGFFLISVELVIGARWKRSAHTRRCLSLLLCRDHLQSWELLLSTRFLLPPRATRGWGSSCHNKTAAGSLRGSQDSEQCQAGIPAPRERLLRAEIRNPLVTDSLNSVYKLSDTIKALRERENGLEAAWTAEGRDYLQKELSWGLRRWNCWLWVPCTLHSRENSLGKEHSLTPAAPAAQPPRAILVDFWKQSWKLSRYAHYHMLPTALSSTKPRRAGFGALSPCVSLKMLLSKLKSNSFF